MRRIHDERYIHYIKTSPLLAIRRRIHTKKKKLFLKQSHFSGSMFIMECT